MFSRRNRRRGILGAVVAVFCGAATGAPAEVNIAQGRIAGESTPEGVRIFRGIPYASPPVGELRWRKPQPPLSWSGVRDTTAFGARCTQPAGDVGGRVAETTSSLPISEDCLYLNVWTGAARANEKRPVIVWVHGGSYIIGTGAQFDGSGIARQGAVFVTFNYRLGALGFLAHPGLSAESSKGASGNYGFADAVAALQWVQKNIARFGGDPARVTVMGQSAGGRFIQVLRGSPCAKGLFKRAIIQSAPVRILPMSHLAEAEKSGSIAADKVQARTVRELRALTAQQVIEGFPVPQPTVDGHCIPDDPWRMAAAGRLHDGELLIGSNADEGTFPYLRAREFGVGFTSAADYSDYVRRRFSTGADDFLKVYPAENIVDFNQAQLEAFRDETAWSARFSALMQARHGTRKSWLYFFSHRPPAPPTGPDRGATHGAEIPYTVNIPRANWTDDDRRIAGQISSYWVNFASRGDPNGPGLPAWPAFEPGPAGLAFDLGGMTSREVLDARRLAIFETLYRRIYGITE
jgi:para-nitrobenzyl esterase